MVDVLAHPMTGKRILRASFPLEEAPLAFRAARDVPGKTWIGVTG